MKRQVVLDDSGLAPVYDRVRIMSLERGSRNDRRRRQNNDEWKRPEGRHKYLNGDEDFDGLKGAALLAAAQSSADDVELDAGCAARIKNGPADSAS